MVFFELVTDDEEEEDQIPDLPTDESYYEMKLEDIKVRLERGGCPVMHGILLISSQSHYDVSHL